MTPLFKVENLTRKSYKVTGSPTAGRGRQDDGFVGEPTNFWCRVQKRRRSKKVTGSPAAGRGRRDDKSEGWLALACVEVMHKVEKANLDKW